MNKIEELEKQLNEEISKIQVNLRRSTNGLLENMSNIMILL
jgi:hypothetical protein